MNFAPGDSDAAEWVSRRCGEEWVKIPGMSQSEQGVTVSHHWQKQRCWSPDDVLDLPDYHGLITFRGSSRATPVYAEPYIDKRGNIRPEYRRAGARLDPYHSHDDGDALPPPVYQPAVTDRSEFSSGNSSIGKASSIAAPSRAVSQFVKVLVGLVGAVLLGAWIFATSHHEPARVDPPQAHPPAHQHHPVKHVGPGTGGLY
jgi:hypothetical protein